MAKRSKKPGTTDSAKEDGNDARNLAADSSPSRGTTQQPNHTKKMTICGRLVLFLLLPLFVGMMGLGSAYLRVMGDPQKKIRIEADFILPFMLTLLLVAVIGFQTGGFSSSQTDPMIKWPKVKKQRKVIHKHVVKGKDPNSISEGPKDSEAKKKD
mmetsp:Transcript_12181/g.19599  ORF Transcript_12181/g.19599 Transcript_12181/m.19599 type:complete len:155 (+) Transcript_12181:150-614(+)